MPRRATLDLTKAIQRTIAFREANAKAYEELRANEVHCRRCGRELTDEDSKKLGIGPECIQKEAEEHAEHEEDGGE